MAPEDVVAATGAAVESRPAFGVWSPAVTPLDASMAPDPEWFVAHARWLLDSGCHGIVVFGTTGEAPSFSVDEREELLGAVLAAGLPADRLIVGTGCPALTDTVRLTAHAIAAGCAGVLVVPPYYYKDPPAEGVFRSYAEIIERTGSGQLRLFLYHFPRLSGVPITVGLIEKLLAAYPSVVAGVKDSGGVWNNTTELLDNFRDELAIFPGSETFLLDALEAGGAGCITATANVNPGGIRAVYDAWRAGRNARPLQEGATRIRRVVEAQPLAPALKHLIGTARRDEGWRRVRPPLAPLAADAGVTLGNALEVEGFRLDQA